MISKGKDQIIKDLFKSPLTNYQEVKIKWTVTVLSLMLLTYKVIYVMK